MGNKPLVIKGLFLDFSSPDRPLPIPLHLNANNFSFVIKSCEGCTLQLLEIFSLSHLTQDITIVF